MLEDRVPARAVIDGDKQRVEATLVFLQELCYWRETLSGKVTDVALSATLPFTAQPSLQECNAKLTTMAKKQKQLARDG